MNVSLTYERVLDQKELTRNVKSLTIDIRDVVDVEMWQRFHLDLGDVIWKASMTPISLAMAWRRVRGKNA